MQEAGRRRIRRLVDRFSRRGRFVAGTIVLAHGHGHDRRDKRRADADPNQRNVTCQRIAEVEPEHRPRSDRDGENAADDLLVQHQPVLPFPGHDVAQHGLERQGVEPLTNAQHAGDDQEEKSEKNRLLLFCSDRNDDKRANCDDGAEHHEPLARHGRRNARRCNELCQHARDLHDRDQQTGEHDRRAKRDIEIGQNELRAGEDAVEVDCRALQDEDLEVPAFVLVDIRLGNRVPRCPTVIVRHWQKNPASPAEVATQAFSPPMSHRQVPPRSAQNVIRSTHDNDEISAARPLTAR